MKPWLLYGATGYTGQLILEEALRKGHRPVIAGRNTEKLEALSRKYGLDYLDFGLDNPSSLHNMLAPFDLVFHAAGPFMETSAPMIQACLKTQTHYVDITGEIPVFAHTFSQDQAARDRGIVLMSGVGFDVIPTDCLARFVADRTPHATHLELAFVSGIHASPGSAKTMLEIMGRGGLILKEGSYKKLLLGQGSRPVDFPDGSTHVVTPVPWGDLETAQRSTGIPNITTYAALPQYPGSQWILAFCQWLMGYSFIVKNLQKLIGRFLKGPGTVQRSSERWFVWACATDAQGKSSEAWLDLIEGYDFTAKGGVLCVEKILNSKLSGALTPSMAFGADLVLEVDGTRRLEGKSVIRKLPFGV